MEVNLSPRALDTMAMTTTTTIEQRVTVEVPRWHYSWNTVGMRFWQNDTLYILREVSFAAFSHFLFA